MKINSVTVVEREVKVFQQNIVCSTCRIPMVMGKYIMMSFPAKYTYTCSECGYEHIDYEVYPKTVMREVEYE